MIDNQFFIGSLYEFYTIKKRPISWTFLKVHDIRAYAKQW